MGMYNVPPPKNDTLYDLAYHHNNPQSRHRHSWRCCQLPWRKPSAQFLRCLKVELGRIRKEVKCS